jgi:hypothetical protein
MWGIEILANFWRLIYLQQKKKHLCTLLSRGGVDRPSPTWLPRRPFWLAQHQPCGRVWLFCRLVPPSKEADRQTSAQGVGQPSCVGRLAAMLQRNERIFGGTPVTPASLVLKIHSECDECCRARIVKRSRRVWCCTHCDWSQGVCPSCNRVLYTLLFSLNIKCGLEKIFYIFLKNICKFWTNILYNVYTKIYVIIALHYIPFRINVSLSIYNVPWI